MIKEYLINLKKNIISKDYETLLKKYTDLEKKIEEYIITEPSNFISLLNRKNKTKEIISLNLGESSTTTNNDSTYIELIYNYSKIDLYAINEDLQYLLDRIDELLLKFKDISDDKLNSSAIVYLTDLFNNPKFQITDIKKNIDHQINITKFDIKYNLTLDQLKEKIYKFIKSENFDKYDENTDLATLYYSNETMFEQQYNSIVSNRKIEFLPKKVFTNSLTKTIKNNFVILDESDILEKLNLIEILLDNKNAIDIFILLFITDKLTYTKKNYKFYNFINNQIIEFYLNIIIHILDKKEYSFCSKYLVSIKKLFEYILASNKENKIINIEESDKNTILLFYYFNYLRKYLDDYYYKNKLIVNPNSLLNIVIKIENESHFKITTKNINMFFSKTDNIFNYISNADNISVAITENNSIYHSLELGLRSLSLDIDEKINNTIFFIKINDDILSNFYKTIEEIKRRRIRKQRLQSTIEYNFNFTINGIKKEFILVETETDNLI